MAGGAGSGIGKGGMVTKVRAAQRAARSGAATVIASGRESDVLTRLAEGELIGSCLLADLAPMAAKKQWLADQLQIKGRLILDAGAVQVLVEQGKSLLPIGVVGVDGEFERGDVVDCLGPDHNVVARGLVNYGASDTRRIMRRASSEIESLLGFVEEQELIHRDNLILLGR
jgi:glutamate 5-kinase